MTRKEWIIVACVSIFFILYSGSKVTKVLPNIDQTSIKTLPIDLSKSPTVLLFGSSSCKACIESAPFYRKLSEKPVQIVVATSEPTDKMEKYIESAGYRVDSVISRNKIRAGILPTLVILDENGIILKTKIGILSKDEQEEILNLFCDSCK